MTGNDDAFNCFWDLSREARSPEPPLEGDVTADVAIIGAGYTGLSTAYHLKAADPTLNVAVLEAETAGFGASGRNGGFVMTLFGSSVPLMKMLHGKERVRDAHHFMVRAIDSLEDTIRTHDIDCDYERNGFLRIATAPAYLPRIRDEIELFQSLGIEGLEWVDGNWLQDRIKSRRFLGGCWEPYSGSLNPVKWTAGLRRLAVSSGARLYERSPVTGVTRTGTRMRLTTPRGTVTADKVVYATNGYSHRVPGMRFSQIPAFTYVIATEPLDDAQLASIGWQGREAIEDGRNFMHYFRLLPDRRIIAGGGPGLVPFAGNMNHDSYPKAWAHLEQFIVDTFPQLAGIKVAYRWGGAFSMTSDFTPRIATLSGGRAICSIGCTGHGVAMTQMNGQIVRDLVLERQSDLTELWFVNRRSLPMPPEPIQSLVTNLVMASMVVDDWWCDRTAKS